MPGTCHCEPLDVAKQSPSCVLLEIASAKKRLAMTKPLLFRCLRDIN
jgi:hypothetical protein